uniref:legumain n=1 Tax=Rhipicephalus zambeziensis TaxID=60191 RepID=A0A224YM56_9ACAR
MAKSRNVFLSRIGYLCALWCVVRAYQHEAPSENDYNDHGVKLWALLVAGSSGYGNYRHQADVCHAYHLLRRHGIPDNRIVVMMYDDIAYAEENPTPGVVVNHINGSNLYPGMIKDYTGNLVTPENFLDVLQGRRPRDGGTGKVIASGPRDHVFVYFADHGAPGLIAFPNDVLYARNLSDVIRKMHSRGQFGKMVIYVEACESGSMFADGLLPNNVSVYATTAADPDESSYACYWDPIRQTYLGDVYSVKWMEDSDIENLRKETLIDQFNIVRWETNTSHVQEYGDLRIGTMTVSQFQGGKVTEPVFHPTVPLDAVDSRDVPVAILEKKIEAAADPHLKNALEGKLENILANRSLLRNTVSEIVQLLTYGNADEAGMLLTAKKRISDFDCYEKVVDSFSRKCFELAASPYALSQLHVFATACDTAEASEIKAAISAVCTSPAVKGIV